MPRTIASFLINLSDSKPKENGCLATYAASLMTAIMSRWKNMNTEHLALATVLAHVSRFDRSVQRLAFTTEVTTRNQLQQKLKAVSFLKQKVANGEDYPDSKKMRSYSASVSIKCNYCEKLGHESTFCLQRRCGWRRPEERSPSQPSDNFKRIPPPSTAKTAVTGFHCQGQGHYASSCPNCRRQDQDAASGGASGSGAAKEKRVGLCVVSAPAGMLH